MLCALIMAGGKGTRFWPLSTEEKPKQFLNLIDDRTMIQMTIDRILPIIPIDRIFICTGERYLNLVEEQLPELPRRNIIIEPEGRNTAPCIALSAFIIERYYKNSNMIVLPSDHLIKDEERFREIILDGNEYLNNNKNVILTLGMKPSRPETGYGYIKYNETVSKVGKSDFIDVDKFVEKPNYVKAVEYLESGNYLWNGGMFMWKSGNVLEEIKKHIPKTYDSLKFIEKASDYELQEVINKNYNKTDAISIDYAVLEKSNNIKVIPSDIGWDDIGTWNAIERYREKDSYNNILDECSKAIESSGNTSISKHKNVVMLGVENILTIETEDTIFVVSKDKMDSLKEYKEFIQR
ncbi:MAG: mannose-1-phosphate guanylyltransferase [Clostridium sp.]